MFTPVTIYPNWKLLWFVAGICFFTAIGLFVTTYFLPSILPVEKTSNPDAIAALLPLHVMMIFMATLAFFMALMFHHFSKITIRIHDDEICLLWGKHISCEKIDKIIWSERSMIVGNKAVHAMKSSPMYGIGVYKNTDLNEHLIPRLKAENKVVPFKMIPVLLRLKDPATYFGFYALTSLLILAIWTESLK